MKTTITAQELTYFYFNLPFFAELQKTSHKTLYNLPFVSTVGSFS